EHEKQEEAVESQGTPKSKVLEIEEVYAGDFEDDEDEKVKSGYKFLAGLAGVLAAMLLAGIVGVLLISNLPKLAKTEAVVVPKIEGMLLDEAEAMAKEKGLTLKQVSQEESENEAPGTILRQSPKSDATISKNGVIQVVVAVEPEMVMIDVPDVRGINQADAQRLLETKGLYGKVEERVHDKEVEVGNIISQSPEVGAQLQEGEVVKLIVSKGAEMVMTNVPNLLGLTREDAEFSLKKEKLMLGTITEEYSATVEQGRIMNQSVSANQSVEQGSLVNIVISKGPEEVKPPVEEEPPVEEVVPQPEVPEAPKEEESAKPEQVTKQHTINLPQGKDQDEYHVVVIFQTDQGTQTLFDGIIKRDEFPKTISITGVGSGQLITHFDGQVEYNDDYSF
ncbi:MAG: PASTA domain-containing protein, partial [Cellulosilyticaceae bacterium]